MWKNNLRILLSTFCRNSQTEAVGDYPTTVMDN